MVMWQDHLGAFFYALVVQFEEHLDQQCYVITYVRDQRIKTVTLFHADNGKTWRVACASK